MRMAKEENKQIYYFDFWNELNIVGQQKKEY